MDKLPETRPHVRAAMTPFPLSIDLSSSLTDAELLMAENEIRHLPVTSDDQLIGVLSHRDLQVLKASLRPETRDQLTITSAVVRDPFVVDSLAPVGSVSAEMARRHIGSALVLHEGKLAGIFTATDACRYLAELLDCMYRQDNGVA